MRNYSRRQSRPARMRERQEALAAARKEIGDEIQKALDEHLSMDEEVETHEQPE